MSWVVTQMTLALGIVFVLLFLFMRVMKKARMIKGTDPEMPGPCPYEQTDRPSKVYLPGGNRRRGPGAGISDAQITLLGKIENKEFADRVMAQHSGGPLAFSMGGCSPRDPNGLGKVF